MPRAGVAGILGHVCNLAATGAMSKLSDAELLHKFTADCDETAFAVLVQRHASMVLGVCRRMTGNMADAEDAFQGTFMVLARKAATRSWQASIAGWLYAVAYRVAARIRAKATCVPLESQVVSRNDPLSEISARELVHCLDEELHRLPEKYRAPLVLCYLQERTRDEAARRLGCPLGTLKSRLERGRELLRRRLGARGVSLPVGMLATALASEQIGTAASTSLVAASVRAAVSFAGGNINVASAQAAAAAHGVLHGFLLAKWQAGVIVALVISVLAVGTGWGVHEMLQTAPPALRVSQETPQAPRPAAPVAEKPRLDLFGDPLPPEALARLGTVRFRPGGNRVTSLAFTNDGKRLVANVWGGIRLWNSATGKELSRFGHDNADFRECVASPDGILVATIARDRSDAILSLWDLASGRHVRDLGKCRGQKLCFSSNSKLLATFGWGENALWDVASGKRLHSLPVESYRHEGGVYSGTESAVFTADNETFVTADITIRFWDVATGKQTRQISGPPDPINKLLVSPDGKLLATHSGLIPTHLIRKTGRLDGFIRIWDVAKGKEISRLNAPGATPEFVRSFGSLAFSGDSRTLVTGGPDFILRVWDVRTGRQVRQLASDCANPWALGFSADGKTLAAAAGGSSVRLFAWPSGKDLFPHHGHQGQIATAVISADGKTVATNSFDQEIFVWDAATGRQRFRLEGHEKNVRSLVLFTDSRTLLSQADDKTLRFWDIAVGKELRSLSFRADEFSSLFAVSNDERLAAGYVHRNMLALIDLATGKEIRKFKAERLTGARFMPDGRTLVAWTNDALIQVWDPRAGQKLRQFSLPPEPNVPRPVGITAFTSYRPTLSPDGKVIAYAVDGQTVVGFQDMATGKEIHRLTDLPDTAAHVAFSHDGRTLAWGSLRGMIGLVEVATGQDRYQFPGRHGQGVTALAFSADGKKLVTGNMDTTALVWDLTGQSARNPGRLSPTEMSAAWADLAGEDAVRAYRTIRKLAATPTQTIPYLSRHLQPVPSVDPKLLATWLADLGSDRFAVRNRATKKLQDLGEQAVDACSNALKQPVSEERRRRLNTILETQWQAYFNPKGERLQTLRALEVLELAGTAEARQLLQILARGSADARLTCEAKASLARLGKRMAVER